MKEGKGFTGYQPGDSFRKGTKSPGSTYCLMYVFSPVTSEVCREHEFYFNFARDSDETADTYSLKLYNIDLYFDDFLTVI